MSATDLAAELLAVAESTTPGFSDQDERRFSKQFFEDLDAFFDRAAREIRFPTTSAKELEQLRESLLLMRTHSLQAEKESQSIINELNAHLEQVGDPPPDFIDEPEELATRRVELHGEIAVARVPLLRSKEAQRNINRLIGEIDSESLDRISEDFFGRDASPIWPPNWAPVATEVDLKATTAWASFRHYFRQPENQATMRDLLPLKLLLAISGVVLAFLVRRPLTRWVEAALTKPHTDRTVAWLVTLRNFIRLILPTAGAGLFFAALKPATLSEPTDGLSLFELPIAVFAVILAGWLGSSLFAPKLPAYRLLPVDDDVARSGTRVMYGLGAVFCARVFLDWLSGQWRLSGDAQSMLAFPLVIVAGVLLWKCGQILSVVLKSLLDEGQPSAQSPRRSGVGLTMLGVLVYFVKAVGVAAPVFVAIGYDDIGEFLAYSMIMTLALVGVCIILFDLLLRTVIAAEGESTREGLGPIILMTLLMIFAAPVLALIWGARRSDLSELWILLTEGVQFGGFTISLGTIATFVAVFAVFYAITQVLRSILRSSVLPRTRMDAGGRNAVLAGVNYVGFFVGGLVAVASTGIDLSSIAIIAGALSVGIGFGLQTIVSNFVSGVILLIERPIKEGDWIEVGENMGYVRDISVRSTSIETFDRAVVILPNSDLVAGTVLNRTHRDVSGRLKVPISVAYDTDPRQVERVLLEIIDAHPLVLEDPMPVVLLIGFGESAIDFEARCWLRDVNFMLSARSDLNFEILKRFREENIVIPFPQRDLHVSGIEKLEDISNASKSDDAAS